MNTTAARTFPPIALAFVMAGAVFVSGCSESPTSNTPPVTTLIVMDTTLSAASTDLLAVAQNRATQTITSMNTGDRIVIRPLDSDVTMVCSDLIIQLPAQPNNSLEARARDQARHALSGRFGELVTCSQASARGGTEFFGGVAEALRAYPDATQIVVVSDACENMTIGNICDPARLAEPADVSAEVPESLTPKVSPGVHITYLGVGRGSGLDGASVEGLRRAIGGWTERMGADYDFVTA